MFDYVYYEAVWQALLATLFTWSVLCLMFHFLRCLFFVVGILDEHIVSSTRGVTALGSAMVFVLPAEGGRRQQQVLDGMLGFAAGVMTSASFWSLLAPALEFAKVRPRIRLFF